MAWRDSLRRASFRGVEFWVDGAQLGAGRRLARHEYPQRDTPFLEDMGRKAREIQVEGFVLGADYMAARDELLDAIEKSGPGPLVHPWLGTLDVVITDCRVTESTREGGRAAFALTCVEAGERREPREAADTEVSLDNAVESADGLCTADFVEGFDVTDSPGWVADDAGALLAEVAALPAFARATLADASGLVLPAAAIPAYLTSLLGTPATLAAQCLSLLDQAVGGWIGLLDMQWPALPSLSTPARQRQAANQGALQAFLGGAATARHLRAQATADHATREAAYAARDDIVARVDERLLEDPPAATAVALVDVRTAAIGHIAAVAPLLPRLAPVRYQAPLPAVVIAWDRYSDPARDASLVALNGVRHPGFCPAGRDLLVEAA